MRYSLRQQNHAHTGMMRRRSCQRKRACRTQLHEEKGISPQLIRRRRKMPQVFFAWRRGLKSVFAPFRGFGQKALRRGTRVLLSGKLLRRMLARKYVCR